MARDNTSYDGSKDRHRSQQGLAPGARGLEQEEPREREREIWAEENEKKDVTWSARQKQAESKHSTRQKPRTAHKAHGQQAQGRPDHRQKPRLGKRTPNLASQEVATGAENPRRTPPNRTRRQTWRKKGGPRKTTSQQRNPASGSHRVWSVHAQSKTENITMRSRRSSKNSTKREQGGRGACEEPAASVRRATKYR